METREWPSRYAELVAQCSLYDINLNCQIMNKNRIISLCAILYAVVVVSGAFLDTPHWFEVIAGGTFLLAHLMLMIAAIANIISED